MAEKKREAEAAIELMAVQYERNRCEEEKRNGLIILEAVYGNIDSNQSMSWIELSLFSFTYFC